MPNYFFFLSYSRANIDIRNRVREALMSTGLNIWTDDEIGLPIGTQAWQKGLEDAIKSSNGVIVILSPNAIQEESWVLRELQFAKIHQKKIYPLLAVGTIENAVPEFLENTQIRNIQNTLENESAFNKEMRILARVLWEKIEMDSKNSTISDLKELFLKKRDLR